MKLQIGIVSDLHCNHSSAGDNDSYLLSDLPWTPSSQNPISSLVDLIQNENLRADVLIVAGDIANKCDGQGLISGWGFLNTIKQALSAKCIAVTPGNHDICSRDTVPNPYHKIQALHPPIYDASLADCFWTNGWCLQEESDYNVLVVNSAFGHTSPENAKQGNLTENQLEQIDKKLGQTSRKAINVAVCHHHPLLHEDIGLGTNDVLSLGSRLLELLTGHNFDLLVHGHKHHPKLSLGGPNGTLPILAAGSLSAVMKKGLASRTKNVFHIIHLESQDNEASRGIVFTWQFKFSRGWDPATWDSVDFPHLTGFGCHEDPSALARAIETYYVSTNQTLLSWGLVEQQFPQVKFMPPSVFRALGDLIQKRGIFVSPRPPDQPKAMGRMS